MAQPEFGGTDKGRAVMIFGSDGAKWIAALIDALGHFQVDVVASGLPGGAAEEATLAAILAQLDVDLSTRAKESGGNLAAIKTALQIIDDFANAQNTIFGYKERYAQTVTVAPAGGWRVADGSLVPSGEVWIVTNAIAYHDKATTVITALLHVAGGTDVYIAGDRALPQYQIIDRQGFWVLKYQDRMRARFENYDSGVAATASFLGYKMKV